MKKLRDCTKDEVSIFCRQIHKGACDECPLHIGWGACLKVFFIEDKTMLSNKALDIELPIDDKVSINEEEHKMTLEEFFDSYERLAIHCRTKEEAEKLSKGLANKGYGYFALDGCYGLFEEETCYNNLGILCNIEDLEKERYKISYVDDMDLT